MTFPDIVVFDVSSLLALGGVIVAVLSAMYSARSAHASQRQACAAEVALKQALEELQLARSTLYEIKRQSRIASHGLQLEIFKALLHFSGQLSANGINFRKDVVWEMWEHARIAEFYFSAPLSKKLTSIVDAAIFLQSARDEWKLDDALPAQQRKAAVENTYDLYKELMGELNGAEQLMRAELRLVGDDV